MYIFANKYGGPLLPVQVERYLKKAGERTALKLTVSSLSLRPVANKKSIKKERKKFEDQHAREGCLAPISPEEWKEFSAVTPSADSVKGRKSIYGSIPLLNAILYHFREKCPIRKLPHEFPPCKAVHSQYRRWSKSGLIHQFFQWRSSKNTDL